MDDAAVVRALDDAYCLWALAAEEHLSQVTNTALKQRGARGKAPQFVWQRALDVKRTPTMELSQQARPWQWLADVIDKAH